MGHELARSTDRELFSVIVRRDAFFERLLQNCDRLVDFGTLLLEVIKLRCNHIRRKGLRYIGRSAETFDSVKEVLNFRQREAKAFSPEYDLKAAAVLRCIEPRQRRATSYGLKQAAILIEAQRSQRELKSRCEHSYWDKFIVKMRTRGFDVIASCFFIIRARHGRTHPSSSALIFTLPPDNGKIHTAKRCAVF